MHTLSIIETVFLIIIIKNMTKTHTQRHTTDKDVASIDSPGLTNFELTLLEGNHLTVVWLNMSLGGAGGYLDNRDGRVSKITAVDEEVRV